MRRVDVVQHDPSWQTAFETEAQQIIAEALGAKVIAIHHIGSTAIASIYAKPIVDLLVEVQDINRVDQQTSAMQGLGYTGLGEYGIPGRRFFRKNNQAGDRTHHLHTFEIGSTEIERHLAFRDYMIAHPEDAQKYSQLKRALAQAHPHDIDSYMDGKDSFIKAIDQKAALWRSQQIGQS